MSASSSPRRLLFLVNDAPFFVSHRLVLARAAHAAGFEVHVATAPSPATARITALNVTHHDLPLSRSGVGPLAELRTFLAIFKLLRRLRPDVIHLVTSKPVIYGGIAARLLRAPRVIAAVAGLGHVFVADSAGMRLGRVLVARAYRLALRGTRTTVIVQNPDDAARLIEMGAASADRVVRIPGSGVDLAQYRERPDPPAPQVVVFAARLLRTKGVLEFIEAARRLRAAGVQARFVIAGEPDAGNNATVTAQDLAEWRAAGDVELLGHRSDIAQLFADSHLVVLPSYYGEGLPKVLIEAAACGRAVITTDMPGCRDAIVPGVTGLLVPPRDVDRLTAAIAELLADPERRQSMGREGRRLAEQVFAIDAVVARHLQLYGDPRRAA